MKRPISGPWAAALLLGAFELTVPGLHGQTGGAGTQPMPVAPQSSGQTPAPTQTTAPTPLPTIAEKPAPSRRKWSLGLRVQLTPFKSFSVMQNNLILRTSVVNNVPYDFSYNTTSQSSSLNFGPQIEAPLGTHFIFTLEALFNRLKYTKTTNTYWGVDNPTTAADERSHSVDTENTKARLFDFPVLVHYGKFKPDGVLSHFYVAAGATARLVSTVRTAHNITNADATTSANSIAAQVSKRDLIGGTVGVGFRFIDDYNIKVTPEVRYTHWTGITFGQDSTMSPRNELQFGIGFSK
jgi:hypothetical protein